ncbi:CAP domain-containing protein [Chelativorans sp. YIM 93263]|uniref:CAP domain-containing protein n=1 Tax=Chelativorans sp. YIM 93263 TaxID=2906648 RepID=UPI002378EEC7|nr:CAP domain-containing protein [Chelativorans sp. YIM 93263]
MTGDRILSRRWFAAACLLLVSVLLAGCATRPTADHTLSEIVNVSALRAEALAMVNQQRRGEGLAALQPSARLNAAAQAHAEDMARRGFYSHHSPEGQDAQARYRAQGGRDWRIIGENIASCRNCASPSEQLRLFQQSWMRSAGHRQNILEARYEEFGFGIASANGRYYVVQTFVGHR